MFAIILELILYIVPPVIVYILATGGKQEKDEMKINQEFIELQKKTGLNNRDLSMIANVSEHTVQGWRKGINPVSKVVIDMLNRFIGLKG